jgi:hypothetical protein
VSLTDLARAQRYAKGKSHYVGIPIVDDGSRRPAIFRRSHLQAAVASGVLHARYDEDEGILILNGGTSRYALRDLSRSSGQNAYQIREELTKWAVGRRRTIRTRNLPPNLRDDAKRRAEVEKLERKLARIHVYRPRNPVIPQERKPEYRTWAREGTERWIKERPLRRALGRLYPRFTAPGGFSTRGFPWAEVYQACSVAGALIKESNQYGRARSRQAHKGIRPDAYMRRLWEFAGLVRKPWDLEPPEPFVTQWESYLVDRTRFLEDSQEAQAIKNAITNAKLGTVPLVLEESAI